MQSEEVKKFSLRPGASTVEEVFSDNLAKVTSSQTVK